MRISEIGPETRLFLESQTNLVLGTVRGDGTPQLSPVWYLWTPDGFLISTISATAKWWNLRRDPRCSACVDDPGTGRMVVAYGRATLEADDVWDSTYRLVAKYYPDDQPGIERHMERIFSDQTRVLLTVAPDRVITRRLDE